MASEDTFRSGKQRHISAITAHMRLVFKDCLMIAHVKVSKASRFKRIFMIIHISY